MSSPRRHRRRNSMDLPTNMSSEINQLNEELNRLYEEVAPQIQQHVKKVKNLSKGTKVDYCRAITFVLISFMAVIVAVALNLSDLDVDDPVFGIAFAAIIVVFGFVFAFMLSVKKRKKNVREVQEEHKVYMDNIKSIFNMLERVCKRTEEILRDLVHKAEVLHHRFVAFETMRLIQTVAFFKDDDEMSKISHLSGKLSEIIRKVSSVSDILKEISEDNKRQKYSNQKEKREQFINDLLKEFSQLKKAVNETQLITDKIVNTLKST